VPLRFACDSDNLADLVGTDVVLTYSDLVRTDDELQVLARRFPGSDIGLIDRGLGDPTGQATIIDVESGARTAADVPGWLEEKTGQGWANLTVYLQPGSLDAVERAAGGAGWWRWFASWGAGLAVAGHPLAMVQFVDSARIGQHIDLSVIHNPHWHPRVHT
jgi:hypothetical protein